MMDGSLLKIMVKAFKERPKPLLDLFREACAYYRDWYYFQRIMLKKEVEEPKELKPMEKIPYAV